MSHVTLCLQAIMQVSSAAGALCVWVHAIFIYANVARDVAPKRAKLKNAMDTLAVKQACIHLLKKGFLSSFKSGFI